MRQLQPLEVPLLPARPSSPAGSSDAQNSAHCCCGAPPPPSWPARLVPSAGLMSNKHTATNSNSHNALIWTGNGGVVCYEVVEVVNFFTPQELLIGGHTQ